MNVELSATLNNGRLTLLKPHWAGCPRYQTSWMLTPQTAQRSFFSSRVFGGEVVDAVLQGPAVADGHVDVGAEEAIAVTAETCPDPPISAVLEMPAVVEGELVRPVKPAVQDAVVVEPHTHPSSPTLRRWGTARRSRLNLLQMGVRVIAVVEVIEHDTRVEADLLPTEDTAGEKTWLRSCPGSVASPPVKLL